MATTTLGKVSVTPKGAWSNATAYDVLDIVSNSGSSYLAKQNVPAGTALTNTSYWLQIASKGDKGDTATVAVGSTTTGNAGTNASVTNSGTSTDGVFDFVIPRGDTGNGIASITKTGSTGVVDHYRITFTDGDHFDYDVTNASSGVWGSITGTLSDQTDLNSALDDKANVDGSYDDLTAGNAEQLVSTVGIEEKTPYTFRTTGGSADVGDRLKLQEVTGGTIAWNQQIGTLVNRSETLGVTIAVDNTAKSITATGTPTATNTLYFVNNTNIAKDHVYYYRGAVANENGNYLRVIVNNGQTIRQDTGNGAMFKTTSTASSYQYVFGFELNKAVNVTWYPQIFDLTQMFGSTIADYIYGLEQANTGDGIAWFKKLFPKEVYAPDNGSLLSVNASAHKTIGFNQWDEQWEVGTYSNANGTKQDSTDRIRSKNYIHVLPNTTYYIGSSVNATWNVLFYDANKTYLSYTSKTNTTFTTPANCYYMNFAGATGFYGTTYNHDICINLHWDGERDGEYEPYEAHSYALDSDLTLRGVPKLDSSNNLYYDGDSYAPDGTVTRKYGIVDLGTLTWTLNNSSISQFKADYPSGALGKSQSTNMLEKSGKYTVSANGGYSGDDKCLTMRAQAFWLCDTDYSTVTALTTALSGVYLVYELATPTTESADAYQETQVCDDFGTEEFVVTEQSGVAVPVGSKAVYQPNLRAKLEMAPDSPDGNGDYIVRQTSGANEYVAITDNATVSGLVTRCPVCPTGTNGTYVLKATVSGSTVTYAWVAQ